MVAQVQNADPKVTVESVETLYKNFVDYERFVDKTEGAFNPFRARVKYIPSKATYYSLVPVANQKEVDMARLIMQGLAGRKKVVAKICSKTEINYNQFSRASEILLLYV